MLLKHAVSNLHLCVPHFLGNKLVHASSKSNRNTYLLQLEDAIHQSLRSRRATRHINIHRYNPITPPYHTITIVIIPAAIRTTAHRNDPSRLRHLIINLSESRRHLVCERTSNDHDIGLSRGSSENYTKSILVVAGSGKVHHFDGAAGQAECHGPEGALASPIGYLIESCSMRWVSAIEHKETFLHPCSPASLDIDEIETALFVDVQCVLHNALLPLLTRQWHLAPLLARNTHWWWRPRVSMHIVWCHC
jgi:hypothetical protein